MPANPVTVQHLTQTVMGLAPLKLAEEWDNVGLLLGDSRQRVSRAMTCLTVTGAVVDEAVEQQVDLVITHHPLPFKALARITTDSVPGRLLWRLARAGVSVFSAHTAMDSAAEGINVQWCRRLGLGEIRPLVPRPELADSQLGAGRFGSWDEPRPLDQVAKRAAKEVGQPHLTLVGDAAKPVRRLAIGCGSGGSFISAAKRAGCDALLTGEANFHAALEAEALDIGLILVGHYASERFAMESLAQNLAAAWPEVQVWPSRREADPLRWLQVS